MITKRSTKSTTTDKVKAKLAKEPGLVGATLLEGDEAASRTETEEKRLRSRPDDIADWVILVDGYDAEVVKSVRNGEFSHAQFEEHGATPVQTVGIYNLVHTINDSDLVGPHQPADEPT